MLFNNVYGAKCALSPHLEANERIKKTVLEKGSGEKSNVCWCDKNKFLQW